MKIITVVLEKRSVGIGRQNRSPEYILPVSGVVYLDVCYQVFSSRCDDGDRQTLNALRREDVCAVPEALFIEMFVPFDDDILEITKRTEVFDGREEVELDEGRRHDVKMAKAEGIEENVATFQFLIFPCVFVRIQIFPQKHYDHLSQECRHRY